MKISSSVRFRSRTATAAADGPHAPAEAEELFRPTADRYRRRLGVAVAVLVAGIVPSAISLLAPEPLLPWLAVPGIACIAVALVLFFSLPALRCPGCGQPTDNGFERFCPACGSDRLRISRMFGTHCDACGRTMGSYKYRNYPIRHCTHCGAALGARGI